MSENAPGSVTHDFPVRVYYEDTDAGAIVYHASYLRFAERGRTEMLRDNGIDHMRMYRESGIAFAVVALHAEYRQPARLDDALIVRTRITRVGGASLELSQNIYRMDDLLVEMTVTLVCIDQNLKAVRLPAEVRALAGPLV